MFLCAHTSRDGSACRCLVAALPQPPALTARWRSLPPNTQADKPTAVSYSKWTLLLSVTHETVKDEKMFDVCGGRQFTVNWMGFLSLAQRTTNPLRPGTALTPTSVELLIGVHRGRFNLSYT